MCLGMCVHNHIITCTCTWTQAPADISNNKKIKRRKNNYQSIEVLIDHMFRM